MTISLPEDVLRRLDDARGDIGRSKWVLRALESALSPGGLILSPSGAKTRTTEIQQAMLALAEEAEGADFDSSSSKPYELPKIAPRKG